MLETLDVKFVKVPTYKSSREIFLNEHIPYCTFEETMLMPKPFVHSRIYKYVSISKHTVKIYSIHVFCCCNSQKFD